VQVPLLVADVYSLKLDEVLKEEAGLPGGGQLDDMYSSGGGAGGGGGGYPPDPSDPSGGWWALLQALLTATGAAVAVAAALAAGPYVAWYILLGVMNRASHPLACLPCLPADDDDPFDGMPKLDSGKKDGGLGIDASSLRGKGAAARRGGMPFISLALSGGRHGPSLANAAAAAAAATERAERASAIAKSATERAAAAAARAKAAIKQAVERAGLTDTSPAPAADAAAAAQGQRQGDAAAPKPSSSAAAGGAGAGAGTGVPALPSFSRPVHGEPPTVLEKAVSAC
jgi:hypothetical protein